MAHYISSVEFNPKEILHTADALCEERGVRFTRHRRRVLELIAKHKKPSKAYDLLEAMQAEDASAKPPTVYRALEFLLEQGLVHRLESLNAYVACSHPKLKHQCYLMTCMECSSVTECCNDEITKVLARSCVDADFEPHHLTLEIHGICTRCHS